MGRVESKIQEDIVAYLRGIGAYVINYGGSGSGAKGTPDLIACYGGHYFAFEIKRPDGSYGITRPQEIRIRQIQRAGGTAEVVTSVGDVATVLSQRRTA